MEPDCEGNNKGNPSADLAESGSADDIGSSRGVSRGVSIGSITCLVYILTYIQIPCTYTLSCYNRAKHWHQYAAVAHCPQASNLVIFALSRKGSRFGSVVVLLQV